MTEPEIPKTCLVTGATGYIGGRLVPELLGAGHRVRVMTRNPERLRDHPWAGSVEIVRADATDADQVAAACAGVDVVYYLIHALGGGPEPAAGERPSPHLRSRAEVARILLAGAVPTAVLRAPVIIGSGSASFEMLRYLTERLPVMITPKWLGSRIQPIAAEPTR